MQHGTVNLCLILLVNYGQTDDICGAGKIRRGDKCCLSQLCVDTGFAECTVSNTKDTCVPCSEGFYLIGRYETSNFADPNVCAAITECSPEEVKNQDGECVCDVSRGYYRIDEGICGLAQTSCNPAGIQLSLNGHCDPCPEGYFKPVSGKQRCSNKSNITCSSTEIILEGNTTTDRKCVKNDDIMSTSTYSPPLSTYINITNDDIDRNGNNVLWKWLLGGVGLFIIVLVVILLVLLIRYYRRQQLQDLEKHENAEDVPLQQLNGAIPIDDDNFEDMAVPYQSPQDNIPNDDDNFKDMAVSYMSPQDNIPNDDDNIDNSHIYKKVPCQSPQDNIPNVTGGPRVIGDNIGDDSHNSGVEGENFTSDTSQTYVKVPYPSHGSSIDSAVRGDEDNSNKKDRLFNPLPGDDRSCQGAVGGDIDGNDTASSINNDNAVRGVIPSRDEDISNQQDRSFNRLLADDRSCQGAVGGNDTTSSINNDNDVNLLHYQPSSEHNSQEGRMVLGGPHSFALPVQNPNAHPLPHNHGGPSDEDDSGFQN